MQRFKYFVLIIIASLSLSLLASAQTLPHKETT